MRKTIFVSLLLAFAFGAKANHWTPVCPSMRRVEVYDMLGRKVYAVDCHSESVEIGVEQSGVYFIMVINDFARTVVKTVFE